MSDTEPMDVRGTALGFEGPGILRSSLHPSPTAARIGGAVGCHFM